MIAPLTKEQYAEALTRRFMSKIEVIPWTGCWIWLGGLSGGEYGSFYMNGRTIVAHRASWLIFKGPITEGFDVCHECDVPPCANPSHLWLGTAHDNMVDAGRKGRLGAANLAKIHCPRQHLYSPENTRLDPNGRRHLSRLRRNIECRA